MITDDKITEIFCTVDEFSKNFDSELEKNLLSASGKQRRRRKATMSDSEIMTVQLMFHLGGYKCFKHFYIHYILGSRKDLFPTAVSYNRFVELESRVFFVMMFFLKMSAFGRCNGVSYVDSTMIPVCHNVRRYMNKVFNGFANDGKGTMGWCHGFKLHFVCNDQAEIITSASPRPTPTTATPRCGRCWQRTYTAGCSPIADTSRKGSSTTSSPTAYTSSLA